MLTAERAREALDYDPKTGLITWRINHNGRYIGQPAGWIKVNWAGKNYLRIGLGGGRHYAHRLIWLHVYGRWPEGEIDHLNGNGLDNRLSNLREVSREENAKNRRLGVNNRSGFIGVSRHKVKGKWRVQVNVNGQIKHLGIFTNKADAAEASRKAREENGFHSNHGTRRPL